MKKGNMIGQGMTAEVYEWGEDKVLKLFFNKFKDNWINSEADIGKIIYEAGIPAPAVFDIVNVDGRKGIIFQKIPGRSLLSHLGFEPWMLYAYAIQMAGLHHRIHQYTSDKLPPQKERLLSSINDSAKILGTKLQEITNFLEHLPTGNNVCHGDLHFNNIIIAEGEMKVIDWSSASSGNPCGDAARTRLIINSPALLHLYPSIISAPFLYTKSLMNSAYLNEYTRLSKTSPKQIDAWILPVAAAKLREKIPGEKEWLLDIIEKRLKKLK